MKGTLCFWDRKGNSSDQGWVLVKKEEKRKTVLKRDLKVFEPFSSQQLIGTAASFKDSSSRGKQHEHESFNPRVVPASSRSGLGVLVAACFNSFDSGVRRLKVSVACSRYLSLNPRMPRLLALRRLQVCMKESLDCLRYASLNPRRPRMRALPRLQV